jgi:hypothetical protein
MDFDHAIIIAGVGFLQAIAVAIIAGLFARESKNRKKSHEHAEKRAKLRAKESLLTMKLMSANNQLASATGRAVKDGHTNGEMEEALAEAQKAQNEYYNFINNIAAEHMAND